MKGHFFRLSTLVLLALFGSACGEALNGTNHHDLINPFQEEDKASQEKLGGSEIGHPRPKYEDPVPTPPQALKKVNGAIQTRPQQTGFCETEKVKLVDSMGNQEALVTVQRDCQFSTELKPGRVYYAGIFYQDELIPAISNKNVPFFNLDKSDVALDLGLFSLTVLEIEKKKIPLFISSINPDQQNDADMDGINDALDTDDDGDGILDALEADCDEDQVADDRDEVRCTSAKDKDGDGVPNEVDTKPDFANPLQSPYDDYWLFGREILPEMKMFNGSGSVPIRQPLNPILIPR